MCYDLGKLLERIERHGRRKGYSPKEIAETLENIKKQWQGIPLTHLSCFSHPELPLIIRGAHGYKAVMMQWGLVRTNKEVQNMTVNAAAETIFEKKSYKEPILTRRAILPINGWFEHQHAHGKSFPYFIHDSMDEFFYMGCVYNVYPDGDYTFAIVTTAANPLVAKIHNKPANNQGPRMALLLSGVTILEWMNPDTPVERIKELLVPYPDDMMDAYTVKPIRGKKIDGVRKEILDQHSYPEISSEQLGLF